MEHVGATNVYAGQIPDDTLNYIARRDDDFIISGFGKVPFFF